MPDAKFHEPVLAEAEDVLAVYFGGPRQWGGKLIITNRRMLFAPIDVGLAETITTYVADKVGVPGMDLAGSIIEKVRAGAQKEIWLRHVTTVEPNGNGGLFSAPGIRVTTATGETIEFGIVKSTLTPNVHPDNCRSRDDCLEVLRGATGSGAVGP